MKQIKSLKELCKSVILFSSLYKKAISKYSVLPIELKEELNDDKINQLNQETPGRKKDQDLLEKFIKHELSKKEKAVVNNVCIIDFDFNIGIPGYIVNYQRGENCHWVKIKIEALIEFANQIKDDAEHNSVIEQKSNCCI